MTTGVWVLVVFFHASGASGPAIDTSLRFTSEITCNHYRLARVYSDLPGSAECVKAAGLTSIIRAGII